VDAKVVVQRRNLQIVDDFLQRVGARTSPSSSMEEETFRMREGFQDFALALVEKENPQRTLERLDEPPGREIGFFCSSIQRTELVGHFIHQGQQIPLHYSIVGSLILKRDQRHFHVWEQPVKREYVLAPLAILEDADRLRADFGGDQAVLLRDTGGKDLDYTQLRIAAVNSARTLRFECRQQVLAQWQQTAGKNPENLLVIHDSLLRVRNRDLSPSMVGIVMTSYVPFRNRELLTNQLMLKEFQRGQVFRIELPEHPEERKYSWFVKLRSSEQAGPEFGLVRLETIAADDEAACALADDLSHLVVEERFPVSFPAPDWDKLIFPLKLCDQYLNSLVPSKQTVHSYFLHRSA